MSERVDIEALEKVLSKWPSEHGAEMLAALAELKRLRAEVESLTAKLAAADSLIERMDHAAIMAYREVAYRASGDAGVGEKANG